jgi:hypothetical protein
MPRAGIGEEPEWTGAAANDLAFIKLASIRIWLRANESVP